MGRPDKATMNNTRIEIKSGWLRSFCALATVSVVALSFVTSCGSSIKGKGFISDANVCRPIKNSEDVPVDFSTGKIAVPAVTGGTFTAAQLSTPEVEPKMVWGFEFLLSNLLPTPATMKVTVLVKRDSIKSVESFTIGPDGATATQPVSNSAEIVSQALEPTWVRGQLSTAIKLDVGESIWLLNKSGFDGLQVVAWWLTTGSGLHVAPLGVPGYAEIPSVQVIHRLVYCE
jgi:hypothetical protein